MTELTQTHPEWRLDRHVPLAVLLAMLLQGFAVIWWAANLETRVQMLENRAAADRQLVERVTRMEATVDAMKETTQRIEKKLDGLVR